MSRRIWYAVDVMAPREAHEATEYGLMEAGALGTETNEVSPNVLVRGYFDQEPEIENVRAVLLDAFRIYNLTAAALIELRTTEVADRDWLAEWKKNWQPVEVGRFIISPTWIQPVPSSSAGGSGETSIVIQINPGMAFGTGTHETTRLCLKAIEKYFRGGSFLDVGTGTGILAIAAAKMFPDARIEACDTDAHAIEIARENVRQNGVANRIDFRVGSVDERTPSADLVCANLTTPVIIDLLPSLLAATCGRLVLSGILYAQLEVVKPRLIELGVTDFEIDQDGEWIALVI